MFEKIDKWKKKIMDIVKTEKNVINNGETRKIINKFNLVLTSSRFNSVNNYVSEEIKEFFCKNKSIINL